MRMDPLAIGASRPLEDSPIVSNLHQSLWDMFIYDEPHPSDTLRFEGLPAFFGLTRIPTYVLCIAIDDYERMAEEKRSLACTHIKQAVKEALGEREYLLIFAHQNCFYLCGHLSDLVTQEVQDGTPDSYRPALTALADRIRKGAEESEPLSLTIGIDFHHIASITNWRSVAQRAIVAQRRKLFEGKNRTYFPKPRGVTISLSLACLEAQHRLLEAVRADNEGGIDLPMSTWISEVFMNNIEKLFYLRIRLIELVILMARATTEVGVSGTEAFSVLTQIINRINRLHDFIDLSITLRESARSFASLVHKSNLKPFCATISKVRQIIESNDLCTISLRKVAGEVGVSYTYLSRLFKKEFGMTFTEYLNKERINRSQRLLLDRQKNITEIAFACGFNGLQQFERVFKRICGTSPSKYRALRGINYRR